MTKLLQRPLKAFALYALIILLISIPVYVFVVDYIWVRELDENNWLTLQYTKQQLEAEKFTKEDIEQLNRIWGTLQPGVSISEHKGKNILKDSVYEVLRSNPFDMEDDEDRFRGLISYVAIDGQPYRLAIETNVEESNQTFAAITVITLLFFVVLILGFVVLNRRIAKNSWRSFYQTLKSLRSFELSKDNSLHLLSTDIQEFQELNASLQQLVKNNVNVYQQQKVFTENASHELQTPLALLKSKLDLLLQETAVTPEITKLLESIEAPLSRLARINKNLLVLAKVENQQYGEREVLDVKEFVQTTLDLFEDYMTDKELVVDNRFREPLRVKANSFLLETLMTNLLSNAIRYSPPKGNIAIELEDRIFSVANSGNRSLDVDHLFERFSTISKEKVGSGLGLAIVKEISNRYGWILRYRFENGKHIFSVEFL